MKRFGLRPWFSNNRHSHADPARVWLRRTLFALAVFIAAPTFLPGDAVGQSHVDHGGTVGIQNDTERQLFKSLICMCGCPRETLETCTCDYGTARRGELRDMLTSGMSIQAIQKAYGARFGTKSLATPTNEGFGALIWVFPLAMIIGAAIGVGFMLRRWSARGALAAAGGGAGASEIGTKKGKSAKTKAGPAARDAYDDRLDEELKDLE